MTPASWDLRSAHRGVAAAFSSSVVSPGRLSSSLLTEESPKACKTASSPPEKSSESSGEKARVQGSREWVASSIAVTVLEGVQGLESELSMLLWQRETAPSESVTAMTSALLGCHKRSSTRVLAWVICLLLCLSSRAVPASKVKNSSDPVEVATHKRSPRIAT